MEWSCAKRMEIAMKKFIGMLVFVVIVGSFAKFAYAAPVAEITTTTIDNGASYIVFLPGMGQMGRNAMTITGSSLYGFTQYTGNLPYSLVSNSALYLIAPYLFLPETISALQITTSVISSPAGQGLTLVSNASSGNLLSAYVTQTQAYIYVKDGNNTVSKYPVSGGTRIWQITPSNLYDIAVGTDGNIYVNAFLGSSYGVNEYDSNGNLVHSLNTAYSSGQLIQGNGYLWGYSGGGANPIQRINNGDSLNCTTGTPAGNVEQLAFDGTNMYAAIMYVNSLSQGVIYKYSNCTLGATFTSGNTYLYGVAVSADTTLWATYYNGSIYGLEHFDASGNILGMYSNGSSTMYQLSFDGKGLLWIQGSGYIYSFNVFTKTYTQYSSSGVSSSYGAIKRDANGTVWIPSAYAYVYACNSSVSPSPQSITLTGASNAYAVDSAIINGGNKVGYSQATVPGGMEYSLNSTASQLYFDLLGNAANIWSANNVSLYSPNYNLSLWGKTFTLGDMNGNYITSDVNSIKIGNSGNYVKASNTGVGITTSAYYLTMSSDTMITGRNGSNIVFSNQGITESSSAISLNASGNSLTVAGSGVTISGLATVSTNGFTTTIPVLNGSIFSVLGANAFTSNGTTASYGGPVTGSTLTQPAVIVEATGVSSSTSSVSLSAQPFTNFTSTGYTGYDFLYDPVLWMGSAGNWINYPLPGWNQQGPPNNFIYGSGYWLAYDPLNKMQSIFGSPYGGMIEAIVLPSNTQDYQRWVGVVSGNTFLQEIANANYFQLKSYAGGSNGNLTFWGGGFTVGTIYADSTGLTLNNNTAVNIGNSSLTVNVGNNTSTVNVNGSTITLSNSTLNIPSTYFNLLATYLSMTTNDGLTSIGDNGGSSWMQAQHLTATTDVIANTFTVPSGSFITAQSLSVPNPNGLTATSYSYNGINMTTTQAGMIGKFSITTYAADQGNKPYTSFQSSNMNGSTSGFQWDFWNYGTGFLSHGQMLFDAFGCCGVALVFPYETAQITTWSAPLTLQGNPLLLTGLYSTPVQIGTSVAYTNITTVTTDAILQASSSIVLCNCSVACTQKLPVINLTTMLGQQITVKDIGAGSCSIIPDAPHLLDKGGGVTLTTMKAITVAPADATNWYVLGGY